MLNLSFYLGEWTPPVFQVYFDYTQFRMSVILPVIWCRTILYIRIENVNELLIALVFLC